MPCAFLARYCSKVAPRASVGCWTIPATESFSSFSESTLPRLSTTETLLTCRPSTLLATRKRMELTAAAGNCALPLHAHEDRGGRLALVVDHQPVFRHDNHHPRRFDLVELADGAGQFALHGAGVIGALHKVGDAEIGLVEYLKSDSLAARNALARPFASGLDKLCPRGR